jgi:hypothetical protein
VCKNFFGSPETIALFESHAHTWKYRRFSFSGLPKGYSELWKNLREDNFYDLSNYKNQDLIVAAQSNDFCSFIKILEHEKIEAIESNSENKPVSQTKQTTRKPNNQQGNRRKTKKGKVISNNTSNSVEKKAKNHIQQNQNNVNTYTHKFNNLCQKFMQILHTLKKTKIFFKNALNDFLFR